MMEASVFFMLSLTRNSNGLCNYCKVNVRAITVTFSVIVITSCSLTDHHHHYELHVRPSYYHTICQSTCFNGCAAVLLLHLLALLLATVGFSVVNVSVACTTVAAMAVIVTVMYVLWSHAC